MTDDEETVRQAKQLAELKQFVRALVVEEVDKAAARATKALDEAATKLTTDAKAAAVQTMKQTLGVVMAALDANLGWPAKNIFARVREELRARGLL